MSVSLAALAAIGSLVSTGIGAAGSASANARAREALESDHREQMARYNRLLDRNYVDSPENAGLLRRMQEMQRERYNQARATNVVAGGTDAHLASMQAQGARVVTDTANGIAERSQAYKGRIEDAKYAAKGRHAQQMFGIEQQRAQSVADAAGQASKAMAGIAAAGAPSDNPYGMFGLSQDDYEKVAQAGIDAATEASVNAQLEASLQETLDDLKRQGY